MSSMLKKTGGLSFKPKAGRRPGAGPPKPVASSTSAPTTRAPTTEPQSQTSTPAASHPSTPAVAAPIETPIEDPDQPSIPTEPPPPPSPEPARLPDPSVPSAPEPRVDVPPVRPVPEHLDSLSPSPPTLQPSGEAARDSAPRLETSRLAISPPSPSHDAQPTSGTETENNVSIRVDTTSQPSASIPVTTSEPSSPEEDAILGSSTATPSPPISDPVAVVSPSDEAAVPQPPAPKKQTPRRRKSTITEGDTGAEDSAPKKKRQRRKSSAAATTEASEDASAEAERPVRRRKRELTPENAEELTVDHSTMTVGELTKDLGIGKRFRHAEEIEQRAREARAKYRLKRLEREKRRLGILPHENEDSVSEPNTSNDNAATRGAAMAQLGASMEPGAGQGVGYDVVDGQIVVHAASLVVDRHNRDTSNLEEVEENDFTNLVNAGSFRKRVQVPGNWTDEETEKFYRLLGMFGTDFETISRLFPGKNRRAIKLKFNKEERLRPNRVNAAMMVRGQKKVNIDMEEYKATQRQWQAKDKILEEHARLVEEHEREVARLREERRAAGLIDDDDDHPDNGKSNAAGSKKGQGQGQGQGDGDIEVIEEDADALGQGEQDIDVDRGTQPEGIQG